jgi:quercetin dioxygenase-like cupin family protein
MRDEIQVVPRDTIRAIHEIEEGGQVHKLGELRDLRWHDALAAFLGPSTELSVSWVRLNPGERLDAHRHPIQSMMIFYDGSGELLGDLRRTLAEGDVVVVPPGCAHGFVGGPNGLKGLSIQFGPGLYTTPEKPRVTFSEQFSFPQLLAFNRERIEEFARRPLFDLLRDGTLENPRKRAAYLDALQLWVDGNQALLFTRQASCTDARYAKMFLEHFKEEVGHDVLHTRRDDAESASQATHTEGRARRASRDAVMAAVTDWFTYQMHVLDNAEKTAIIHLVIENASSTYHRHAAPVLAKHTNAEYFAVHVEADAHHAALGEALLRDATPETCARLRDVVAEAWAMIGAMTDRLVEITRAA